MPTAQRPVQTVAFIQWAPLINSSFQNPSSVASTRIYQDPVNDKSRFDFDGGFD